jgi:DNA invertase Pin-like site-specific DNA recombinase
MRVALYTRVSREEQVHGYSLEAQLEACRAYAAAQGWTVVREFVEPGLTGTNDRRPAFQAMIAAALAGEFDVILVHKYDRLARNRYDAVLYKRMLREKGVAVVSATEPGTEDGPAGMLVEGMLEVVAEWYSLNLSAEVRKGLRRKAANGEPVSGSVPLGYNYEIGTSWVSIAEMGARITEAFEEFASSEWSLRSWADAAYSRGYRSRTGGPIWPSSWQEIFRNRFYLGVIVYDGQEYQGKHVALTDEDTFMKVQAILDSRPSGGQQRPKRKYLLSGLLWSATHQVNMVGMTAKQRYVYYRAKVADAPELLISEDNAESQLVTFLDHVVVVDGADLNKFPVGLRLALLVAPRVGCIYEALQSDEDRRALLTGVVSLAIVEKHDIVDVKLRAGFEFDSDKSGTSDSNPGNPITLSYPKILATLIYAEEMIHA